MPFLLPASQRFDNGTQRVTTHQILDELQGAQQMIALSIQCRVRMKTRWSRSVSLTCNLFGFRHVAFRMNRTTNHSACSFSHFHDAWQYMLQCPHAHN